MIPTLVVYCVLITIASAAGGVVPLATLLTHRRMQLFLSFAAGAMLGAVFFHMLPEAVESAGPGTLRWAGLGLLALFLLERFFAYHRHEDVIEPDAPPTDAHAHSHGQKLQWEIAALGLAIHTLVGGFALASAVAASSADRSATAWGVFLATLLHKPADALTIVSLMLRAGVTRARAHLINVAFSLLVPAGALVFFVGRQWLAGSQSGQFTATALAFSAGTFLCIALTDVLPELHFHEHDRLSLTTALLLGIGLMLVTGLGG